MAATVHLWHSRGSWALLISRVDAEFLSGDFKRRVEAKPQHPYPSKSSFLGSFAQSPIVSCPVAQ